MVEGRQRIAIIGGGISGNTAAHILSRRHDVTLFEKNDYLGGHTNTRIVAEGPDAGTPIDTGFIVCNERNYPNFYRLLEQLGVKLQDSEMSFGFFSERDRLAYLGPSLSEFLRLPSSLLRPKLIGLFFEQRKFGRRVLADLHGGKLIERKLSDYLDSLGVSRFFRVNYLYPLIGSIWSGPDTDAQNFPAATFATFFKNHGMLDLSTRPKWQTVVGGSQTYVQSFRKGFQGRIVLDAPISAIARRPTGVEVSVAGARMEVFDHIVLAVHADEALTLLSDASVTEREVLGTWKYSRNQAVLHSDTSLLPGSPRNWASWNYVRRSGDENNSTVQITYYMNRLQNLQTKGHYLVTLNQTSSIDPTKKIYEVQYTHPIYSPDSVRAQGKLKELSGYNRTLYAGAHMGYGFHEDGVRSGIAAARFFGMEL